jgi:hypothetical protein
VAVVENPRKFVAGDVAIAHVDLTRIPPRWLDLLRRYPRVVNGALVDISKRHVAPPWLAELDGWSGPVIVKTDENCAGSSDIYERASRLTFGLRQPARAAALLIRTIERLRALDPRKPYPVFDRLADVPHRLRMNRRLVIQRFVPEPEPEGYALRFATFFGRRAMSVRFVSRDRIVKSGGAILPPVEVETPAELLDQLVALGADYGKADYVMHEGRPVLLDVNRTPTFAGPEPKPRHLRMLEIMGPGLDEVVRS